MAGKTRTSMYIVEGGMAGIYRKDLTHKSAEDIHMYSSSSRRAYKEGRTVYTQVQSMLG